VYHTNLPTLKFFGVKIISTLNFGWRPNLTNQVPQLLTEFSWVMDDLTNLLKTSETFATDNKE
jgi:hypothetical protein